MTWDPVLVENEHGWRFADLCWDEPGGCLLIYYMIGWYLMPEAAELDPLRLRVLSKKPSHCFPEEMNCQSRRVSQTLGIIALPLNSLQLSQPSINSHHTYCLRPSATLGNAPYFLVAPYPSTSPILPWLRCWNSPTAFRAIYRTND